MKRILIAVAIIIVLVGACTVTLMINKNKIDAKMKLEGNVRTIPVFVMEISAKPLSDDFTVNGSFTPVHELTLLSEGQGKVRGLYFAVGDFVKEGQVLAKLDDDLIVSNLALANAMYDKARRDLQKYEGMLKSDAVSSQQVEDARLALRKAETDVTTLKKQLDYSSIKAPIQGTITKRHIETGSLVMPGTMIADIVDISRLKFIANVSESEAVRITKGMNVEITSSLFPGVTYQGKVLSIGIKADESKRFPAEIGLENDPKHPLKAGMFGTASFRLGSEREALSIPRHSIVGSIREPRVYVVENNRAILKDIRIGSATDQDVEVLEGLKAGEVVVTSGQINLDNGTPVTIVNKK
jgi:membrane fusion protein, multidrug efflux system